MLQCDYCNRGHSDKVDQSNYRKITVHSEKVSCGPISSALKKTVSYSKHKVEILIANPSRKQNVSPDIVFLFEALHIIPRRHYLLDTSCYFVIYQQFFATISELENNMRPQVKIITDVYAFCLRHSLRLTYQETLAFFSGFKRSRMQVVIC